MKDELRCKIAGILWKYKCLSIEDIIDEILAILPPQKEVMGEEEILSILKDYRTCKGKKLVEVFNNHCDEPRGEIIEIAKSLAGHIENKEKKEEILGEDELGEFIRINCSKYLIEEAYCYPIARILSNRIAKQPNKDITELDVLKVMLACGSWTLECKEPWKEGKPIMNEVAQNILNLFYGKEPSEPEYCKCESGYGKNGICGLCGKPDGTGNFGTLTYGFRKGNLPKEDRVIEEIKLSFPINLGKIQDKLNEIIRELNKRNNK